MIGEISRDNFALNEDTKRVLDFYKNIGFLETFSVQLTEKYTGYDSGNHLKRSQFTYCMVKNALASKYIIIQDLDEIVGVNFSRYQNLQEVLWKLEEKKISIFEFFSFRHTSCSSMRTKKQVERFGAFQFILS